MIERGVTPHLSRSELEQLGFNLIVCPLAGAVRRGAGGRRTCSPSCATRETTAGAIDRMVAFDDFNELVGLEARYADEARYT